MPFFDFSNTSGALTVKPQFWLYWAITTPLTMFVLVFYLTYLVYIKHKQRSEDKRLRELDFQKENMSQSATLEEKFPSERPRRRQAFPSTICNKVFTRSVNRTNSNSELGLPEGDENISRSTRMEYNDESDSQNSSFE